MRGLPAYCPRSGGRLHIGGPSPARPEHKPVRREIIRRDFTLAGLRYFNPHSFRDVLVRHFIIALNLSAEEMKAISQNLGLADVLTTFTSYGVVLDHRQGGLVVAAGRKLDDIAVDDEALFAAIRLRLSEAA